MSLKDCFDTAPNLGPLAKAWFKDVETRMTEAGIELPVKTGTDGAASLLAAPAMIAKLIKTEGLDTGKKLRVLIVTNEPLSVMDEGIWLNTAADLAGCAHIDFYTTCETVFHSNLYDAGIKLGLRGYTKIEWNDAHAQEWDLALWFHPAIEAQQADIPVSGIMQLYGAGVPIYACMYNEMDALVQSYGLNCLGVECSWLNGPLSTTEFSRETVNKFGYSTSELGIEGGWGAVLTKLAPASFIANAKDWPLIKTAMQLYQLDGSTSGPWALGERINGIAFNTVQAVGLIGEQAINTATGVVLTECPHTKTLILSGRIHNRLLKQMPSSNLLLLPWAAKVRLITTNALTKEDRHRESSIQMLSESFNAGLLEAGICLARGLEGHGAIKDKQHAHQLYERIGAEHPFSSYYLAHYAYAKGDTVSTIDLLKSAADFGYTLAMTDLGRLLMDSGDEGAALKLFCDAADFGDEQGYYESGLLLIRQGRLDDALAALNAAAKIGHVESLDTAEWLITQLIEHKMGDAGALARNLKDIQYKKRNRESLIQKSSKASE